jgi:hypothetical protein
MTLSSCYANQQTVASDVRKSARRLSVSFAEPLFNLSIKVRCHEEAPLREDFDLIVSKCKILAVWQSGAHKLSANIIVSAKRSCKCTMNLKKLFQFIVSGYIKVDDAHCYFAPVVMGRWRERLTQ